MLGQLPTLFHKDKMGRLRMWRVWHEDNVVYNEYGLVDGEKVTATRESKATNVGRSNERTPEQQAAFDAKSQWQHKRDRKYSETPEEAAEPLLLPMLIAPKSSKENINYDNAFIQRKFDGVRCLATLDESGEVKLLSRQGKPYNVPHVAESLKPLLSPGLILDGELYAHGFPLQTVISMVKKYKPESKVIQYHVYDIPMVNNLDDLPFCSRMLNLISIGKVFTPPLALVETTRVYSKEEAKTKEQQFVSEGYEGAIVRNGDGLYLFGLRSRELSKIKSFTDTEFTVIGSKEGEGSAKGQCIFRCITDDGKEFNVTPKGNAEVKAEYWNNRESYHKRQLTVRHFGYTVEGSPFIPVGIAFREPEDL